MKCAHCGRWINKPSATTKLRIAGDWMVDEHYGPVCALKLGLITPKKPTERAIKMRATKAYRLAQADLFDAVTA